MGKKLSHITKKYRIPNTCQVDIIVVSTAPAWGIENFNFNKAEKLHKWCSLFRPSCKNRLFLSSAACIEQVWYVSVVEFIITTSARPCLPARTLHNKFFAHNRLREDLFSFLSPCVVVVVFCLGLYQGWQSMCVVCNGKLAKLDITDKMWEFRPKSSRWDRRENSMKWNYFW